LKTVVGAVVSVLRILSNTSSMGTGSNLTIGIQSSVVAKRSSNQGRLPKKDPSGSVNHPSVRLVEFLEKIKMAAKNGFRS
jgi:hypothetical protein